MRCGLQVVPNSASRASLGETSESGLFDIFQREFGAPGSVRFEDARTAFIKSSAGYSAPFSRHVHPAVGYLVTQ
jgi:hypothetical protein